MKIKKALSAALACVMLTGTTLSFSFKTSAAEMPFTDLENGGWYCEYVQYVYDNKIMEGMEKTKFGPSESLSRAMFVTILGRMSGQDTTDAPMDPFPDTIKNSYYSEYVGWAAELGIIKGYDDGTFRPDNPLTRAEMAVAVSRYADALDARMTREGGMFEFADQESVAAWAADSLDVLRNSGVILGDDGRNFNPDDNITRAESAAIIMRLKSAIDNAWQGYLPDESDDAVILGASYLYWTGSLCAGGMGHSLDKDGDYPSLQAYMSPYHADWTYVEPNTIGVSINYMNIDVKKTPVVKICYGYSGDMGRTEPEVLYIADKTLAEERGDKAVYKTLPLKGGSDENGMKTATVDLSSINSEYNIDYSISIANLLFKPCSADYDGHGTFDVRYIGFFKDEASANAFSASSDKEIENYLKNYEPYTTLKWFELTGDVDKYYSDLVSSRIKEVKNTKSEVTPEQFKAAGKKCYYISSIHGDDNNDGLSPDRPWKSLSKLIRVKAGGRVEASTAQVGEAVFFERGSVWYPEKYQTYSKKTLSGFSGVTYGAYGEGPKPLFTCALDFSSSNNVGVWTLVPGTTDIYELKPELIDEIPEWRGKERETDIGNIFFNGGEAIGVRVVPTDEDNPFGEGKKSYNKGYVCNGYEYYEAGVSDMTSVATALTNDLQFLHDRAEGRLYLCSKKGNPAERFNDIKVSRNGSAATIDSNSRVDNLAFMYSSTYGVNADGKNIKFTNCEIGCVGGSLSSVESGIETYGATDGSYMYNNYVHDVCDGPLTSQNGNSNTGGIDIKNLEYIDNVIVSSGNGAEIWNSGPLDEEGRYTNRMMNLTVKNNIMAYIGYGVTQNQDTNHNKNGSVICGSMYGEISRSIVENNIFYRPNGDVYGCYMATYEQPRGWQAKGNTYVCASGLPNSNIGYCYETLNYINHDMWKRARVGFRYDYETLVWYTQLGIDPTGTYYHYEDANEHEKKDCFFMTGYWAEKGGFNIK